jgi:hypothetical protein
MAEQPKVIQLLDRSKLPTREREVKEYRFRNRLHQAASQARARLQSQARENSAAADRADAKPGNVSPL